MTAFNYQQIVVDGVEISEVWGVIDAARSERREMAAQEWLSRHADRARANGYQWSRATVDPKDSGHLLFEAWPTRPDDEGPPRWFGGDG